MKGGMARGAGYAIMITVKGKRPAGYINWHMKR